MERKRDRERKEVRETEKEKLDMNESKIGDWERNRESAV